MTISQNTDQVGSATDLLLEQYKDKPKLIALLSSYIAEIQKIEDALWQLYTEVGLDTAVGVQLDGLGEILGEDRKGKSDADYRIFLRARILSNLASGTIEELLSVIDLISTGLTFELEELFPAAFVIEIVEATTADFAADAFAILDKTRAAGVGFQLLFSLQAPAASFTLSSQSGVLETSAVLGLANSGQTSGGYLIGVIE